MFKPEFLIFLSLIIFCRNKFLDNNSSFIKSIIANGLIVTGEEGENIFFGHILIDSSGKINKVLSKSETDFESLKEKYPSAEIIEAQNKIVIPGGIDSHVHLEYPQGPHHIESCDDFYTGSVSALCGGTTTFIDFVEADREKKEKLEDALIKRLTSAQKKSVIDFSFHMSLNYLDDTIDEQIKTIINKYGINTFKIYTAYDNIRLENEAILEGFKLLKKHGGLPIIHCEEDSAIKSATAKCVLEKLGDPKYQPVCHPSSGEKESVEKMISLAKEAGIKQGIHIVHVSSELSLLPILKAQEEGFNITGEVCPQHLILTSKVYEGENGNDFICSPPMREQKDINALWIATRDNIINFLVTDHCPFTSNQRRGKRVTPEFRNFYDKEGNTIRKEDNTNTNDNEQIWFKENKNPPFYQSPGGIAGIETRMMLAFHFGVVNKKISLAKFVQLTSTNTAKRYGLYPKKGVLKEGSDADIVIIDPQESMIIKANDLHQNSDVCPYEGIEVNCKIKTVIVGGIKMFDNYKLIGEALNRRGNFIKRKGF